MPKYALNSLLLKKQRLNLIHPEIASRKLLFLDQLITEDKMAPIVRCLFGVDSSVKNPPEFGSTQF